MENILIIGAHYDDAELGAGGTAAKLAAEGKKVYKLTLTDNVTYFKQMNINVDAESSKKESALSCKVLGITEIENFPVQKCNELRYSTLLMQAIEKIIFDLKIDTLFFHYSSDMNQDHVEASKICMTAGRHCKNLLMYQSNGYVLDKQFCPTVFFDISDFISKKEKALKQYGKAHNRYNRLFETCIARNATYGYGNNVQYCEAFVPIKVLN